MFNVLHDVPFLFFVAVVAVEVLEVVRIVRLLHLAVGATRVVLAGGGALRAQEVVNAAVVVGTGVAVAGRRHRGGCWGVAI